MLRGAWLVGGAGGLTGETVIVVFAFSLHCLCRCPLSGLACGGSSFAVGGSQVVSPVHFSVCCMFLTRTVEYRHAGDGIIWKAWLFWVLSHIKLSVRLIEVIF